MKGFQIDEDNIDIEIFDQNGKLIYSNNISLESGQLEISTSTANIHEFGTYYLRIIDQGKIHILKFIKMK